jgi:hypothetical protein
VKELLQEMLKLRLSGVFPNITIALHIFISLPLSVASGECTFNVLKQVKKYYLSAMRQDRLNGVAVLNISCDLAWKLDFPLIMNLFSEKNARNFLVFKIFHILN